MNLRKVGDFTVNLTLEHDTKEDISISAAIQLVVTKLSFSKYIHTVSDGKTIKGADLMKNVLGSTGYTLKSIVLKDNAFGTVSGTDIMLNKAGSFNATLTLSKGGTDEDLDAEIEAVLPNLTFTKLVTGYRSALTKAEIFANVKGNSTGYSIQTITLGSGASAYATATATGLDIKKVGVFTATLVLTNPNYFEVTVDNAQFQIDKSTAPTDLAFVTFQKTYSSGGSFTAGEILGQVNGTKAGYTLKTIENLRPTGIAQIAGDKKSLQFTKAGNFTATLTLEQPSQKVDARIANAKFEIAKAAYTSSLSFTKLKRDVLAGGSATVTGAQLMSQITGATSEGFTLKSIALDNASFGQVSGTKPNLRLTLKKRGNFTATLVLEHDTYADVTINNAQIESIMLRGKAEIISWKFGDNIATVNGTDIDITLAFGTGVHSLKATLEISEGATISPDPTQSINYANPVYFKVTAQDKTTTQIYRVTVNLERFVTSCTGGWRDAKAYSATINHGPTIGKIALDVNSADFEIDIALFPGASIAPDPKSITDWSSEQRFTVRLGSSQKTYDVKVTVSGRDIIKVTDADIKATMKAERAKYGDTADYNYIDVSEVTNMEKLFMGLDGGGTLVLQDFNGDITKWDVSKVRTMRKMLSGAKKFNQPIGDWDVSKVEDMTMILSNAQEFNQPIGDWDVSNVTAMEGVFQGAWKFNQPIGNWTVSKVRYMNFTFNYAKKFNQPIGNWDVSSVSSMLYMFGEAEEFNQPIGNWTVSNVGTMGRMFWKAKKFDQDISGWDVKGRNVAHGEFSQGVCS